MDLDILEVKENEILEEKEEVIKEEVKEEVKESGSKNVKMTLTLSEFKQKIIDYYEGGDDIDSITLEQRSSNTANYVFNINNKNYQLIITVNYNQVQNIPYVNADYGGYSGRIKQVWWEADDNCCGFNIYTLNYANQLIEIVSKTGQSIDDPTVSGNSIDYTEYLETIIERLEGIEENVKSVSNNIISTGNGSNNNNNGKVSCVSQNILTTPINEYGLTDSLLVIGLSVAFITLMIVIVRRLIYKWS